MNAIARSAIILAAVVGSATHAPGQVTRSSAASNDPVVELRSTDERTVSYTVSLLAGQFIYNRGGDQPYPYASLRVSRGITRFLEAELGVGYSRLATELYRFGATIETYQAYAPFMLADVALNAKLPLGRFIPYLGVSGGLFRVGESREYDGFSGNGSSIGGAAGAKFMFGQRIGMRGEFRIRGDKHDGSTNRSIDAEQVIGVLYHF